MEIDVHEPATGPKQPAEPPEVTRPGGEVMVRVHHQHEVARAGRQQRVVVPAEDRCHIGDPGAREPLDQNGQHARLGVHGVDPPPRPDRPGDPPYEIPGSGPDLGHRLGGSEAERAYKARRTLPLRAIGILEPAKHQLEVPRVSMSAVPASVPIATGPSMSSGAARSAHVASLGASRPPQRSHPTRPCESRPNSPRRLAWSGGSRATTRSGA